ncbi:hypothetical protein KY308_00465 [Candidatus Woesearchaeota archaeon]|nr:hypothetical protein [Candidatus Woesearchaeota archaeon]
MKPERFKRFFGKLSSEMTVDLIAKDIKKHGSFLKVKNNLPVLDALELLEKHDSLITEDNKVLTKEWALSKPVKTLFYAMIIELEYKLYKVLKPKAKSVEELQSCGLNDLIKLFFADEELFKMQNIYDKKTEMKKDMKAISSFRNVIMHSNKKIDLEAGFSTVLNRKRQALKLLSALDQLY